MKPYTLVTGASRGLGLALAQRFAARGTPLILAARSHEVLEQHAQQLSAQHQVPVHTIGCDLSQQSGVDALIEACSPHEISGVVNNAGFGLGAAFAEEDAATLKQMLFLNMQALTQLSRHFVPQLMRHKGVLLNVASQAAFQPMPYFAAYAASKAYVLHLTQALHHELRPHGVRVLALCPGATQTDFFTVAGINVGNTHIKLGTVESVIDAAMNALDHNQPFVLPGAGNKAALFLQRFCSRTLAVKLAARLMQR